MKKILLPLLLAATLWGYGEGILYWAPACKPLGGKHGGYGMGENPFFTAINSEGNGSAILIRPDLSHTVLPLDGTSLAFSKPAMGGYYALVLNHRTENKVESAIRYLSFFGRPVKISPTKLTALSKADLEIVPDPLHREHDHYTASKTYRFLVKFQGSPLAYLPIVLETDNHSQQTYTSNAEGAFEITLPNDFNDVRMGKRENKPSEFLLHARYGDGKILFITSITMPYYVNPNDYWQSQPFGAGAIVIGFLGGLLLYRRTKTKGARRG